MSTPTVLETLQLIEQYARAFSEQRYFEDMGKPLPELSEHTDAAHRQVIVALCEMADEPIDEYLEPPS